jgi:CBS domain-containing protein
MITPIQTVMTKDLITVPVGTLLTEAADLMTEKRIRHLPVTSPEGRIVGIVSLRDLDVVSTALNTPVDAVMNSPVRYVNQELSLRSAILKMLESKVSCLLVSDDKYAAVGIVTTDDLLWYLAHLISEEKDDQSPNFDVSKLQAVGDVAHELSLMGI